MQSKDMVVSDLQICANIDHNEEIRKLLWMCRGCRRQAIRIPNPPNLGEKQRTDLTQALNRPPPSKFTRTRKDVWSTKPNPDSLQVNQQVISTEKTDQSDFDCVFLKVETPRMEFTFLHARQSLEWRGYSFEMNLLALASNTNFCYLLNSLLLCHKFKSSRNGLQVWKQTSCWVKVAQTSPQNKYRIFIYSRTCKITVSAARTICFIDCAARTRARTMMRPMDWGVADGLESETTHSAFVKSNS